MHAQSPIPDILGPETARLLTLLTVLSGIVTDSAQKPFLESEFFITSADGDKEQKGVPRSTEGESKTSPR